MLLTFTSRLRFTDEGDLFLQALAFRGVYFTCGERVIGWAVAALQQGADSPSLRTLAGIDPEDLELESYLNAAAAELGRERPEPRDAHLAYALRIARAALDRHQPWRETIAELYVLYLRGNYDVRLDRFLYLEDDLELMECGEHPLHTVGLTLDNAEVIVRLELEDFLAEHG